MSIADGDVGVGPEPGFTWDFLACSGAVAANIRETVPDPANPSGPDIPGEGQYPGSVVGGIDHSLPQITQAKNVGALSSDTDFVTITIGGNDAQFTDIGFFCASHFDCFDDPYYGEPSLREWFFNNVRNNVRPALVDTFEELRAAAPNAAVLALGYPWIFGTEFCATTVAFSEQERRDLRIATNFLNQTIAEAAMEAGIHFEAVVGDFATHGVCDTAEPWIIGIQYVAENQHAYNLHPTAEGQLAYARAVSRFLGRHGIYSSDGFFPSGFPKNPNPVPPAP